MDKDKYVYDQRNKQIVRHKILKTAVETLTTYREEAACIRRNYVRDVYDYFTNTDDLSNNYLESNKIEKEYIINWEFLHDSYVGTKSIKDLTVCYLCGPEPNNDFQELLDMGILPQNIWAFETEKLAYKTAVATYDKGAFPQPRILKQNIESFFKYTPKRFDIVYIDACGSIPSAQHALRCLTTLCLNARLNTPGIVITNFSSPDSANENVDDFIELIATYLFFKEYPDINFIYQDGVIKNEEYAVYYEKVKQNFILLYGEFISTVLRDIPSLIVPIQRAQENSYVNQLIQNLNPDPELINLMNCSKGLSVPRFFIYCQMLQREKRLPPKFDAFLKELGNPDTIFKGFYTLLALRNDFGILKEDVQEIKQYFEMDHSSYRFLDKPHSNLIFDTIINQLAYPMHFSPWHSSRFMYTAKTRKMYTDVTVYDECRYLYEWLPALHQIISAYSNKSWQYVFRFALDGLIKSRYATNNEFYFQGSVIPFGTEAFPLGTVAERLLIDNN